MIKHLASIFFQGLVAILPLAITGFVLVWLGSSAEQTFGTAVKWILPDDGYVTGIGVLCGLVFVFAIGLLVNIWGVPRLVRLGERFINRIPLVKTIYGAVHDLLGSFSKTGGLGGGKVVLVTIGDTGIVVGIC